MLFPAIVVKGLAFSMPFMLFFYSRCSLDLNMFDKVFGNNTLHSLILPRPCGMLSFRFCIGRGGSSGGGDRMQPAVNFLGALFKVEGCIWELLSLGITLS